MSLDQLTLHSQTSCLFHSILYNIIRFTTCFMALSHTSCCSGEQMTIAFAFTILYCHRRPLPKKWNEVEHKEFFQYAVRPEYLISFQQAWSKVVIKICNHIDLLLWSHGLLSFSAVPATISHICWWFICDWETSAAFQNFVLGNGSRTRWCQYFAPLCSEVRIWSWKI